MKYTESHLKWLEAGYEMFALEGPENFKVEQLAKNIGLNKSGFYHYFIDRETFYEELLDYHNKKGVEFAEELSRLKNFMPGYPELLVKYQTGLHIQMQLRKNTNIPLFREVFFKVKTRNNKYQLPLWAQFIQISDMNLAAEMFEIALDLMVIRLQTDKITFDYLVGIFNGIKVTMDRIRLAKQTNTFL